MVEAVLFSSSKPLKVSEISERTGLSEQTVRKALKTLETDYDDRGSAIRIAKTGYGHSMILREEYSEQARSFAPREVPNDVLRTAAMIAYHQPVLQSELARTLGSRVYEDVKELKELGLISGKKKGQTLELSTTKRFSEYFGIDSTRKESIKKWMEERAASPKDPL